MSRYWFAFLVAVLLAFVPIAAPAFDFIGDGDEFQHTVDIKGMTCRAESVTVTANKFIIYSDSTEIGDTLVVEELVVTDHLSGDSLSVTATKTLIYSDSVVVEDTLLVKDVKITGGIFGDSLTVSATIFNVWSRKIYLHGDTTAVDDTLTAARVVISDDLTVDDVVSGDSLSLTVTSFKPYCTNYYWPAALIDTVSMSSDDSLQLYIPGITANPTEWRLWFTPLEDWVGAPEIHAYWADTVSVYSTGNETGDVLMQYTFIRLAK